jgi:hypothetical protein
MRLSELSTLNDRLKVNNKETDNLIGSVERLEVILEKLDHYVSTEQSAQSESLLTRFSKHLRHLLHEGASPSIKVHENIEYLEGSLSIMSAMNQHNWSFEIDDEQIAQIDINRNMESITLNAWVFEILWELVIRDEIRTTVVLKLFSDTYNFKAMLCFNEKEVDIELKLRA